MTDLIDIAGFRSAARRDAVQPGTRVFRASVPKLKPKVIDEASRTIRFCFSDGTVDRMGDTIDPTGWRLTTFERNPVALWSHDSNAPPIGRASRVLVEDQRLMGDIQFATPEIYEFADTIYKLVKGEFLNAVSVGFIPLEYSFSDDDGREWGIDFETQELVEISVCPVPANANALIDARSKGIDTRPLVQWAERALDGAGHAVLPKTELQRLRRAASEPRSMRLSHRRSDGMGETDPSAGGAVVATCGRAADEACGMSDPEECEVHRTGESPEEEARRIAGIVRRTMREELRRSTPLSRRRAPAPRRRADDAGGEEDGPEMRPEHEECIRSAAEHLEAMGDALDDAADHHEQAMSLIGSVCDDLDEDPGADAPGDGDEKAIARRLRRARRLAARHTGA